jgi:hypothetical protein
MSKTGSVAASFATLFHQKLRRSLPAAVALSCLSGHTTQAAVVISFAATQNMTCSAGICAPTATQAVLNRADLKTLLASGAVTVTSSGNGVEANDIQVRVPLAWPWGNKLALKANRSVSIGDQIAIGGIAGLTVKTNEGGGGGELSFTGNGRVSFDSTSSALSINGVSYTLVDSIQSLAVAIASNPTGAYALAHDYDAERDGTYQNSPITTEFDGVFEGLGNSVSYLNIEDSTDSNVGLFALVGASGTLRDITMVRADVYSTAAFAAAGSLVGDVEGMVAHASAVGSNIDGEVAVGGLAGCMGCDELTTAAQITDSTASGFVSSSYAGGVVGGLIGEARAGTTSLSSASTRMSGFNPGGLVGFVDENGVIDRSFATGKEVSEGHTSGGLVSGNYGVIENSYSTGNAWSDDSGSAGGLEGYDSDAGSVSASYSTGHVRARPPAQSGGFVGFEVLTGHKTDCYWDTDTSGIGNKEQGAGNKTNDPGITGLSTKDLQAHLPHGFDPKIWAQDPKINDGLPYLIDNPPRE